MARDPAVTDALVQTLGASASHALQEWAESQARSVRLTSPPWQAKGYTGALLAAINVSREGESDTKLIVKVCPPGPYARETAAHHRAKAVSDGDFYARHLVEQLSDAYPTPDGGFLMFQEIAGASLAFRPLAKVPDDQFADSCTRVVEAIISRWNKALIRTVPISVGDFLRRELRNAWDAGGSVHELASHLRLLSTDSAWLTDTNSDQPLPNPLLMMSDPALGSDLRLDIVTGPMHGDLHLDNVLIPEDYGELRPDRFRLVDLSTFEPDAPITRDPVTLMLSSIAPMVNELRPDEQEALLSFVLRPWASSPSRLSALTIDTLEAIYRSGNESVKALRLGDWRSQFILSVQATALLFTSFEAIGERGRWWFFRLAARAGAEFLRVHNWYRPRDPIALRRPMAWPNGHSPAAVVRSLSPVAGRGTRPRAETLDITLRNELVPLIGNLSGDLLSAVYHNAMDSPSPHPQPNWRDANAVVQWLLAADDESGQPVPTIIVYLDKLAHAVDRQDGTSGPSTALLLHQWINTAAEHLAVSDENLRQLCIESDRHMDTYVMPGRVLTQEAEGEDAGRAASSLEARRTSDMSGHPGGAVINQTTSVAAKTGTDVRVPPARRLLRGNIPARNPDFTGREDLLTVLAETLSTQRRASVVPQALHGLGGVGKTQLAAEYVYRHDDEYDVIWWITAEDPSQVRVALSQLAERLEVPPGQDMKQTVSLVLDALSTSALHWLLVYDNVNEPDDVARLVPSAGGHVIITSRNNAAWTSRSNAIEVDVFLREESVELLRRNEPDIDPDEASQLAEKVGDLPLALQQAASWCSATGMPVDEYLALFDENIQELMLEGKPADYPEPIYVTLKLAVARLREHAPAAAELLELFAFLGPEPVSVALLRLGRTNDLSQHLARALNNPIELNRAIREIRRLGLGQVDVQGQRVQVHRLAQHVLRKELREQNLLQSRDNVQKLLAKANPAYPDDPSNWPVHAQIGPHIRAAELIEADDDAARAVVLDQIRYLFKIGDYEGSRDLAESAYAAWSQTSETSPGPDGELTLIAARHLANDLRVLGEYKRARELDSDTYERLRSSEYFGEDHEHTLYTANGLGVNLRLAGDLQGALAIEEDNVRRHERVFGLGDEHTWRAQNNLAVSLRHLGEFQRARDIDDGVAAQWRVHVGPDDNRTLFAVANLARDLYGLGQYAKALEMQRKALPRYRDALGDRHSDVLLATRTVSIALRKTGNYADARDNARDNYHDHHTRFGARHEHTLTATVSYANALRCCGELGQARSLMHEAVDGYRELLGAHHPLTLAANIDLAVALRSVHDRGEARALDTETLAQLEATLGPEHPYTLCAASGLANDHALAGDREEALRLSQRTLELSRGMRGEEHPDTLSCELNTALDLLAVGREREAQELRERALSRMREVLGIDHPERADAMRGQRAECDVEVPPT